MSLNFIGWAAVADPLIIIIIHIQWLHRIADERAKFLLYLPFQSVDRRAGRLDLRRCLLISAVIAARSPLLVITAGRRPCGEDFPKAPLICQLWFLLEQFHIESILFHSLFIDHRDRQRQIAY